MAAKLGTAVSILDTPLHRITLGSDQAAFAAF
jgi:hypothetical protein